MPRPTFTRVASIDQTINEPRRFVIRLPEPLTAEEWEANVRAGKYGPAAQAAVGCLSSDINASETSKISMRGAPRFSLPCKPSHRAKAGCEEWEGGGVGTEFAVLDETC